MNSLAPLALRPHQIDLLQRTVARDCSREEFDLFIATAESFGLDPFRKQIEPLILNKGDPARRRLVPLVTIYGQRMIAQRCGNYRAASEPTDIVTDETLKSPANPQGILFARVYLWQQDRAGHWFPIVGEAYWDEFAPCVEVIEEDPETGAPLRTGERRLDPSSGWARMPRLMIAKCATSQALRAGWPEQFGGIYLQEEFDRTNVEEASASDIAAKEREQRRLRAIAGDQAFPVSWDDPWVLENVSLLDFARRARAWLETKGRSADEIRRWADSNRASLRTFWAKSPAEALELKRTIEALSRSARAQVGSPAVVQAGTREQAAEVASESSQSASDTVAQDGSGSRSKRLSRANRASRRSCQTESVPRSRVGKRSHKGL